MSYNAKNYVEQGGDEDWEYFRRDAQAAIAVIRKSL